MTDISAPVVAAFDLDGTLTEGGSVFPWLRHIAGSASTYQRVLRLIGPLSIGAIRSGRWADNAKERLFHGLLAGRALDDVLEESRTFALGHLAHEGRADVLARLEWHLAQGHDVVIVSASPQIYVEVIAEALGATAGLGTRLGVDPRGTLTGSYLGRNCRGREKMRRLEEWIGARGYLIPPTVYAYGNSRGDRRLLSGATYPFDAGKLGRVGALRKFPRLTSVERVREPDREVTADE
ncbi:MAG TPA: HAD-IB family hydrolase [Acidimicrobiales bacterium]|nr:HAD-IB family hydrolase [Acidimicrobiales bacterium]